MTQDRSAPRRRGDAGNVRTTILVCAGLLLAGAAALVLIFSTEPTPTRETQVRETAMLVDVTRPEAGSFHPVIQAMGTVRPAHEITSRPRVGGQVTGIGGNFTPGGFVAEGEVLLTIEDADYQNALAQRESELAQAESELEMELGQQDKARQDYQSLGRELSPDRKALVLRQPQLQAARAAVKAARAAVEQARLNLERTKVTAPFDAHVLDREVNRGSQVAAGDALGRLTGLDTYWVETTIPVDRLRWLDFADGDPGHGSPVEVRNRTGWPEGVHRDGYLYRLVGELESGTRMARALVAVDDPLARKGGDAPRLMIGAFVEARITGREIPDVVRLDRDYLRRDDTVWLMRDGRLAIQPVDIVLRDSQYAYIRDGLAADDQVVTTSLATVKAGVALRTGDDAETAAPGATRP